jgi:hypothetical protein
MKRSPHQTPAQCTPPQPQPDRSAGQQADQENAALRNQQQGYRGPKLRDEGRDAARGVAKKQRESDR